MAEMRTYSLPERAANVKTLKVASVKTNQRLSYAFLVNFRRGTYTWVVSAKDIAGNVQAATGRRTLKVT